MGARAQRNIDTVRQEFRKQASLYSPHPKAVEFVVSGVGLSPLCSSVLSFDSTAEMLARAQRTAESLNLRNMTFHLGDAARLPFHATFDIVVSRLAIHHFADPSVLVSEMARVCRPGGRVIVADIVADDDPAQLAETDRLEILRDPSHAACTTVSGLLALLESTGFVCVKRCTGNVFVHPMNAKTWMDNSKTEPAAREEIERCLVAELEGGKLTGLKPYRGESGELMFCHRYAVAQGLRW
mmetsp:Transcript_73094/g.169464  ORF Transcript_73094/g.169464 Transcript_73094/m.169464 type:complete len:240 (-) Transcript_73094:113-832(-)